MFKLVNGLASTLAGMLVLGILPGVSEVVSHPAYADYGGFTDDEYEEMMEFYTSCPPDLDVAWVFGQMIPPPIEPDIDDDDMLIFYMQWMGYAPAVD